MTVVLKRNSVKVHFFSGRFFTCPVKMTGKAKVCPDKWTSLSDNVC